MTKKQWTTPDQRAWLEALVPKFVQAQKDSTTSKVFFPTMYDSWYEIYPARVPTEAELKATKIEDKEEASLKVKADIRQFQSKVGAHQYN